jgi:hypothetical protein
LDLTPSVVKEKNSDPPYLNNQFNLLLDILNAIPLHFRIVNYRGVKVNIVHFLLRYRTSSLLVNNPDLLREIFKELRIFQI